MKLSNTALGSIMMCLQKSLLTQEDIVPMLQELDFQASGGELVCLNPPKINLDEDTKEPILQKAFEKLSVTEE